MRRGPRVESKYVPNSAQSSVPGRTSPFEPQIIICKTAMTSWALHRRVCVNKPKNIEKHECAAPRTILEARSPSFSSSSSSFRQSQYSTPTKKNKKNTQKKRKEERAREKAKIRTVRTPSVAPSLLANANSASRSAGLRISGQCPSPFGGPVAPLGFGCMVWRTRGTRERMGGWVVMHH